MLLFILLLLLGIHLKISVRAFRLIDKSRHLTTRQKHWNRLLVIFIPFIWAFLFESMMTSSTPGTHDPRIKKRRREMSSHFHESTRGIYG